MPGLDQESVLQSVTGVKSVDSDYKARVQAAVATTFTPKTDWQLHVLTTVTLCYLNEIGGEPKLCKDGSKVIQAPTRTYLNRAINVASHADLLDRTTNRLEQICIYEQYEGNNKRAQFIEDLMNIQYRLSIRLD